MLDGVGGRVRDARQACGLTQNEVSIELEVTIGTVQAWEYERAQLTLRRAAELAGLFGVSIDYLAWGDGPPPAEDPRIARIRKIVNEETPPA